MYVHTYVHIYLMYCYIFVHTYVYIRIYCVFTHCDIPTYVLNLWFMYMRSQYWGLYHMVQHISTNGYSESEAWWTLIRTHIWTRSRHGDVHIACEETDSSTEATSSHPQWTAFYKEWLEVCQGECSALWVSVRTCVFALHHANTDLRT